MTRLASPRVVVLGGGFAGLAAAAELPAEWRVTLVDRTRHFEFLPNIHELVSGVKTPRLLRLPRDRIVRDAGHRFVRAGVEGIDLAERRVHLEDRRPLPYDALIVALGGVNATHGVPGVETHALLFKSVDECARIGRRLEELATEDGPHEVVIVGGGLEGVEALGEMLRRWRQSSAFRIHLVEARARLLPEAPPSLDRHVRRLCRGFDVHFHTGAAVSKVQAGAVALAGGRILPSAATIWTGGPTAPPVLAASGLAPKPGAWAPVEASLRSAVAPEVFVAGDAAELPSPLEKQAYHALDMGRHAARNVRRLLDPSSLRPFRPAGKPTLVSFGDLSCFLVAGQLALAGPPLSAAKEGVFELVMAQIDRRSVRDAAPAAARRLHRAARQLAWPALRSPSSWVRLSRVRLLSAR